jgi:hypothetical protein
MSVIAVQLFHSCHLLYYNSAFVQHSCLRIQHELSCCYFVILSLWVSDRKLLTIQVFVQIMLNIPA